MSSLEKFKFVPRPKTAVRSPTLNGYVSPQKASQDSDVTCIPETPTSSSSSQFSGASPTFPQSRRRTSVGKAGSSQNSPTFYPNVTSRSPANIGDGVRRRIPGSQSSQPVHRLPPHRRGGSQGSATDSDETYASGLSGSDRDIRHPSYNAQRNIGKRGDSNDLGRRTVTTGVRTIQNNVGRSPSSVRSSGGANLGGPSQSKLDIPRDPHKSSGVQYHDNSGQAVGTGVGTVRNRAGRPSESLGNYDRTSVHGSYRTNNMDTKINIRVQSYNSKGQQNVTTGVRRVQHQTGMSPKSVGNHGGTDTIRNVGGSQHGINVDSQRNMGSQCHQSARMQTVTTAAHRVQQQMGGSPGTVRHSMATSVTGLSAGQQSGNVNVQNNTSMQRHHNGGQNVTTTGVRMVQIQGGKSPGSMRNLGRSNVTGNNSEGHRNVNRKAGIGDTANRGKQTVTLGVRRPQHQSGMSSGSVKTSGGSNMASHSGSRLDRNVRAPSNTTIQSPQDVGKIVTTGVSTARHQAGLSPGSVKNSSESNIVSHSGSRLSRNDSVPRNTTMQSHQNAQQTVTTGVRTIQHQAGLSPGSVKNSSGSNISHSGSQLSRNVSAPRNNTMQSHQNAGQTVTTGVRTSQHQAGLSPGSARKSGESNIVNQSGSQLNGNVSAPRITTMQSHQNAGHTVTTGLRTVQLQAGLSPGSVRIPSGSNIDSRSRSQLNRNVSAPSDTTMQSHQNTGHTVTTGVHTVQHRAGLSRGSVQNSSGSNIVSRSGSQFNRNVSAPSNTMIQSPQKAGQAVTTGVRTVQHQAGMSPGSVENSSGSNIVSHSESQLSRYVSAPRNTTMQSHQDAGQTVTTGMRTVQHQAGLSPGSVRNTSGSNIVSRSGSQLNGNVSAPSNTMIQSPLKAGQAVTTGVRTVQHQAGMSPVSVRNSSESNIVSCSGSRLNRNVSAPSNTMNQSPQKAGQAVTTGVSTVQHQAGLSPGYVRNSSGSNMASHSGRQLNRSVSAPSNIMIQSPQNAVQTVTTGVHRLQHQTGMSPGTVRNSRGSNIVSHSGSQLSRNVSAPRNTTMQSHQNAGQTVTSGVHRLQPQKAGLSPASVGNPSGLNVVSQSASGLNTTGVHRLQHQQAGLSPGTVGCSGGTNVIGHRVNQRGVNVDAQSNTRMGGQNDTGRAVTTGVCTDQHRAGISPGSARNSGGTTAIAHSGSHNGIARNAQRNTGIQNCNNDRQQTTTVTAGMPMVQHQAGNSLGSVRVPGANISRAYHGINANAHMDAGMQHPANNRRRSATFEVSRALQEAGKLSGSLQVSGGGHISGSHRNVQGNTGVQFYDDNAGQTVPTGEDDEVETIPDSDEGEIIPDSDEEEVSIIGEGAHLPPDKVVQLSPITISNVCSGVVVRSPPPDERRVPFTANKKVRRALNPWGDVVPGHSSQNGGIHQRQLQTSMQRTAMVNSAEQRAIENGMMQNDQCGEANEEALSDVEEIPMEQEENQEEQPELYPYNEHHNGYYEHGEALEEESGVVHGEELQRVDREAISDVEEILSDSEEEQAQQANEMYSYDEEYEQNPEQAGVLVEDPYMVPGNNCQTANKEPLNNYEETSAEYGEDQEEDPGVYPYDEYGDDPEQAEGYDEECDGMPMNNHRTAYEEPVEYFEGESSRYEEGQREQLPGMYPPYDDYEDELEGSDTFVDEHGMMQENDHGAVDSEAFGDPGEIPGEGDEYENEHDPEMYQYDEYGDGSEQAETYVEQPDAMSMNNHGIINEEPLYDVGEEMPEECEEGQIEQVANRHPSYHEPGNDSEQAAAFGGDGVRNDRRRVDGEAPGDVQEIVSEPEAGQRKQIPYDRNGNSLKQVDTFVQKSSVIPPREPGGFQAGAGKNVRGIRSQREQAAGVSAHQQGGNDLQQLDTLLEKTVPRRTDGGSKDTDFRNIREGDEHQEEGRRGQFAGTDAHEERGNDLEQVDTSEEETSIPQREDRRSKEVAAKNIQQTVNVDLGYAQRRQLAEMFPYHSAKDVRNAMDQCDGSLSIVASILVDVQSSQEDTEDELPDPFSPSKQQRRESDSPVTVASDGEKDRQDHGDAATTQESTQTPEISRTKRKRRRILSSDDDDDESDKDTEDGCPPSKNPPPKRHQSSTTAAESKGVSSLLSKFAYNGGWVSKSSHKEQKHAPKEATRATANAVPRAASKGTSMGKKDKVRTKKGMPQKKPARRRGRLISSDEDEEYEDDFVVQDESLSENERTAEEEEEEAADTVTSDEEDDGDEYGSAQFSQSFQTEVLEFFNTAAREELEALGGCSRIKAERIIQIRPFGDFADVVEKMETTKWLSSNLIDSCEDLFGERRLLSEVLNDCSTIACKIQGALAREDELLNSDHQMAFLDSSLSLKPYQLIGVNWMKLLHKHEINGILADEMGLGKTIQVIAFLASLLEEGDEGPHLVVAPASTLDNWHREFNKWAPSMEAILYTGDRDYRMQLADEIRYGKLTCNVLITSYNTATNEQDYKNLFRKLKLQYSVYDEGHMLKNIKSLRFKSLMKIKSQQKLLLTGTPLQNNLLELMSLISFVVPKLDSPEKMQTLQRIFSKVTGGDDSSFVQDRIKQAKQIMQPFVLRRVKDQVLKQLPQKNIQVEVCPMVPQQKEFYHDLKASYQSNRELSEIVGRRPGDKTTTGAIMELRKLANHPLLMRRIYTDDKLAEMSKLMLREPTHHDANPDLIFEDMGVMSDFELHRLCQQYASVSRFRLEEEKIRDSGKFRALDKILPKIKEQGLKVLLFSQFVMMLDILEPYMKLCKHTYLRMDGSTSVVERSEIMDKFTNDPDIFVFLLSTKACGLGINLTIANTVILHDIDYNPHNDKQAEDRCHRMGQTKEVTVIKLVSQGTIDESMLQRAQQKLHLERQMISGENADGDEEKVNIDTLLKEALEIS